MIVRVGGDESVAEGNSFSFGTHTPIAGVVAVILCVLTRLASMDLLCLNRHPCPARSNAVSERDSPLTMIRVC